MRRTVIELLEPYLGSSASLLVPGWFGASFLAVLMAGAFLILLADRRGAQVRRVARAAGVAYVAAILAGIALPSLFDSVSGLLEGRVRLRWAGMTSYCGFFGACVAVAWHLRRSPLRPLAFADLAAAPAGLAIGIVRVGCFLAGCDYGSVTASTLGVRFPVGSPAFRAHVHAGLVPGYREHSLPVHPTQLYEAALGLALVVFALALSRTSWARNRSGRVFFATVLAYALGRCLIETLRGDAGRGVWLGLSTAQLVVVIAAAAVAVSLLRRRAASALAAAALVVIAIVPAHADDGAPMDPYGPPGGTAPMDPYPATTKAESPAPVQPKPGPPNESSYRSVEVAALLGAAASMNRRSDQVPALGGVALSVSLRLDHQLGLFLDLDSLASKVAAHGSVVVGGTLDRRFSPRLDIGVRAGVGTTLVNFEDPIFLDQLALTFRAGAVLDWALTENVALIAHPMTFDLISSAALGGPILTYQVRLGVAYRFRERHRQ